MPPSAPTAKLFMTMMIALPGTIAASEARDPIAIEVFVTSEMQVTASSSAMAIYELDGLAALDRELSEGLSAHPATAQQQALARINELGTTLRAKAERAAQGLVLAQEYGITKVPAVVFDQGISVVYGLTDIDQAIEIYRQGGKP